MKCVMCVSNWIRRRSIDYVTHTQSRESLLIPHEDFFRFRKEEEEKTTPTSCQCLTVSTLKRLMYTSNHSLQKLQLHYLNVYTGVVVVVFYLIS